MLDFPPENTFALVVGIDHYKSGECPLPGPAMDAIRFVKWLLKQKVPQGNIALFLSDESWDDEDVKQSLDSGGKWTKRNANRDSIGNFIDKDIADIAEKGTGSLIIYWGGHGLAENREKLYLLTQDANTKFPYCISVKDLQEALQTNRYSNLKNQLVIIDSCAVLAEDYLDNAKPCHYKIMKGREPGKDIHQFIMFSSHTGQTATDITSRRTGAFSECLYKHLEANNPKSDRDFKEILKKVQEEMEKDYPAQQPRFYINWDEEIEDLLNHKGFINRRALPDPPRYYFHREKEIEAIRNHVLAAEAPTHEFPCPARVVGIHGMGGIGKTVLATALVSDKAIKANFQQGIFWVQLGRNPNISSCQEQLVRDLGKSVNIHNGEEGRRYLRNEFYNKRCLVILDDVWSVDHAKAFDILSEQSVLIITSRDSKVISEMEGIPYDVSCLESNEALDFLKQLIEIPDKFQTIAEKIVENCGKLPWAIKIIGAMLKMHPDRWENYLQALECGDLAKFQFVFHDYRQYPQIFNALEVSINELKEKDKQRYFDFGIFNEEMPIPEYVPFLLWKQDGINALGAQDLCDTFVELSILRKDNTKHLFIHKLLLDYIHNKQSEEDIKAGHKRLIDSYSEQCQGKWHTFKDEGYLFQHLGYHLCEAGLAEDLCELLTRSPDWLRKRADNFPALSSYYADTRLAIDCLPEPTNSKEIINLISLYSARKAVIQEAKRYSNEDLVALVQLHQTFEALEYVRFRQEEQEIIGTLKIAETCLIEKIDINLLSDPLRKISNVARDKPFCCYQNQIDSLRAKVFAHSNQFRDAIDTAHKIDEINIQNDTILDIVKVAMELGHHAVAYELIPKISSLFKD